MEIYIGIVKKDPGWTQLLKQEGLPFKKFSPGDTPTVLIVNDISMMAENLEYLREGGSIITDIQTYGKMFNCRTKAKATKFIIPDESTIFDGVGIIDTYCKRYILYDKDCSTNTSGIYEFTFGKGNGIALPFNISSLIRNTTRMMKFFYTSNGKMPSEVVSTVTKGEVRKLVINAIRYIFKKKQMYYIHKWYYPQDKNTAFTYRVDTDKSNIENILKTQKIADSNSFYLTFFIDIKGLKGEIKGLNELKEHEIAVHCYEHRVFKDPIKNKENFLKAKENLLKVGITPYGIAVPYGIWDESLGFVIEDLGFLYSSEFSLAYDDLPQYPPLENRLSKVLQLPVHPISPGTLLYAKNNNGQIKAYFQQKIDEKFQNHEPIFLYGHSEVISRYPEMLNYIIHTVKEKKNIYYGTYIDFYRWWVRRLKSEINVTLKENELIFKNSADVYLHIISPEDKETFTPMNKKVSLSKLEWKEIQRKKGFDKRELVAKGGRFKLKIKEIENWLKR